MTDAPLPPDLLAERLAEVYLVVGPLYRRVLRDVERDGAPAPGVRMVLDLLRRDGPATVPAMARAQSLSRQFVQRTVNEAEQAGLVRLVANPVHRRSRLVEPTATGSAAIDAVVARERARLGRVGDGITAAEVDACLRVLGAMLDDIGELDDHSDADPVE